MPRYHFRLAHCAGIVMTLLAVASTSADTVWTVESGGASLRFSNGNMTPLAIHRTPAAAAFTETTENISPASTLIVTELSNGGYRLEGVIAVLDQLSATAGTTALNSEGFVLRFVEGRSPGTAALELAPAPAANAWLIAQDLKIKLDSTRPALMVETGSFQITPHFAAEINQPELAGRVAAAAEIIANVRWAGGEIPAIEEDPTINGDGAPRAPTVCPGDPGAAIGPDVIVGELYDVASWGTETLAGVPTAAFSVGTISCNLGSTGLNWFSGGGGGGTENRHPVIGQNLFRLKTMPDGSARIEHIGQSWLKHGFTALTNSDCCTNCTGAGGSSLPPGCSDPYGAGLNGGQTSAGPKYQVNAFSGVHIHPIANPGFSGNVMRRLEVKTSDLNPVENGGGTYFIEGQYVAADDAAAGNQRNNASYREVEMTGGGTSWTMNLTTHPTQRQEAGIRAWKDHVSGVVETDVNIPGEGLVIVAARANQTPSGTWHYEYAVQNICSDRSIGSVTVPVSNPATLTNIGFHDVPYHSGEPFDGADWPADYSGGQIQWQTTPFATNNDANAIRWGTMYNFRFDANAEPTAGEMTLGIFKPGSPTSVTAATIVPGNLVALSTSQLDPIPEILAPCTPLTIGFEITPGTQSVVPGTEKLHYRFDNGPFLEKPLTALGGASYLAEIPGAACGGVPQFYIRAEGDGGGFATAPLDAPTNVFTYLVGIPETGVVLDVDFESGLPGGWTAAGLWNIASTCAPVPLCGTGSFAYYGDTATCNYVTGTNANAGNLMSPPIALPLTGTITLSYCSSLNTENSTDYDHADLLLNGTPIDHPNETTGWETRMVDLTAYAGQSVTLQFAFNTVDGIANNHRGWQIDNLHIVGDNIICDASVLGDLNDDGLIDAGDIEPFIVAVMAQSVTSHDLCRADFNAGGVVETGDIPGMVSLLVAP